MNNEIARSHHDMALEMLDSSDAPVAEKAAMLSDIAGGIQRKARNREQLEYAIALHARALSLLQSDIQDTALLRARIAMQLGFTRQLATDAVVELKKALEELESALPVLTEFGDRDEIAELNINLGLIHQSLAAQRAGDPRRALDAYHVALAHLDRVQDAAQFAIVQNNLALVLLSMCSGAEGDAMREALAVQAFEAGLAAVNAKDHPAEYAMLQNNLGNALQQVTSAHPIANRIRALEAYDTAIALREQLDNPAELAGSLANRAHCRCGIPDDPEQPVLGNRNNLECALADYRRAQQLLADVGAIDKQLIVEEAALEIEQFLKQQAKPTEASHV